MATRDILRTRFARDIVTEFLPPERPSNKILILAAGCPGYPGGKDDLMQMLSRKGFWVFNPRYRGTWESDGIFLEHSPEEDMYEIMNGVSTPFEDLWSGAEYVVKEPEVYLIGGSFGGPAAILASRDRRVQKAVAISPVIDWRKQEETIEPLKLMDEYVPKAFGHGYRAEPLVWTKLAQGHFYNPIDVKDTIDGKKLLIIHAKNDMIVHFAPAETFAKEIGARFVSHTYKGHMGAGKAGEPHNWKHISRFFFS